MPARMCSVVCFSRDPIVARFSISAYQSTATSPRVRYSAGCISRPVAAYSASVRDRRGVSRGECGHSRLLTRALWTQARVN